MRKIVKLPLTCNQIVISSLIIPFIVMICGVIIDNELMWAIGLVLSTLSAVIGGILIACEIQERYEIRCKCDKE